MRELAQVRRAVVQALNDAGVRAVEAFPEGLSKDYGGPVAAVAVGTAEGKALGFCNYLGERYDEAAGTVRELYGKQLEGEITVEIRAERAAACESAGETAAETLLSGLRWEALTWEKTTGMFLRRGRLRCQALFLAESREDGEVFLDFILKGVMQSA